MNKKIFIYLLFMLVILSATVGAVSASANTTESSLLSVDESYIGDDVVLSSSNEVSIENDDKTLGLSNEGSIEESNGTLSLSNEEDLDNDLLGWGESVETTTRGCDYVQLSNGYTGFCASRFLTFPTTGTQYLTDGQYILTHDHTHNRIDNKLRLAIVHYADNPQFHEKITIREYAAGAFSRTQQLIWYLSNYDALAPYSFNYLERDQLLKNAYYDIINRHNNGEWIPEEGVTYNDGTHEIKYEFLAFKSGTYQTLIGYKKTIKEIPSTPKNPGMEVNKKSLTPNVKAGEQTQFLITVRNTGDIDLNNVFVKENMPADLEYADYTNKDNWRKDGDIFYYNNVLKVGQSADFIIIFNTNKTGSFTNVVVAGSKETENKTGENKTTVYKPGLDVQKITLTPLVLVGNQAKFEIVVKNTGDVTLNNVFIEESSYDGLTFDHSEYQSHWVESIVNGKYRWTLNTPLFVNEVSGLIVVFNTTGVGTFTNVVVAGSDESENKTSRNTTKVVEPKLDVQKITLTPLVLVGDQAKFEIVVRNTGDVPLHNVVLEETSYEGLIYDSFTDNGLWSYSDANGKKLWTLNRVLNVNEIANLFVNFKTVTVGNFTNIVTAGSDETKNKIANNTTIVYNNTEPVPEQNPSNNPDINIEKIALDKVVVLGNQAVFEIIVSNTGDVVLHDVCVSEDSFNGLVYDSWYDNTGLWTKNRDLTWTMNSPLFLGEISSFYVVFNTTKTGVFTNIVSVDSKETGKKSANDNVEVIKPDFAVEKIALNRSVMVGEQVTFEIVVQNLGQVDLNNVVVREDSFNGLVYDSFKDYTGLWTKNGDLSWSLNVPLVAGEYAGLFVTFNTTAEGKFVNVVVADSKEIPNKKANDTVEVLKANLEVQKVTINRTVYVGEKVMFEIIVHNAGKVILNDVTVRENSFDGLSYDSFIDNYNLWTKNSDLSWTLNTPLYAGEYLSFFVVFNTNKAGTFNNFVSASSDKTPNKNANNITTVIDRPVPVPEVPVTPEEPVPEVPVTPNEPVTSDKPVPDKNETHPPSDNKTVSEYHSSIPAGDNATGNPLFMLLLVLVALGVTRLRRKD